MNKPYINVCIRCGKPRIEVKTWTEKSPSGPVIHTLMSCPDKECQTKVEEQFAEQKLKRDKIEKDRLQRKEELKQTNLQKKKDKASQKR